MVDVAGVVGIVIFALEHVGGVFKVAEWSKTGIDHKEKSALVGGAICAGLKVTVDALVGKVAQLNQFPLEIPPAVLAGNTIGAMQSGLVLGHLCMVEGLIERMKKELDSAKGIAAAGLVSLLSPHTGYFDMVDPLLTLDGLGLIMERQ